jgi:hypothetical protein
MVCYSDNSTKQVKCRIINEVPNLQIEELIICRVIKGIVNLRRTLLVEWSNDVIIRRIKPKRAGRNP